MRLKGRGSSWKLALAVACAISVLAMSAWLRAFQAIPRKADPQYLSPGEIAISADGRWLYVVCERSDELRVVDTQSGLVVRSIAVGHVPRGLALSPDGRNIYVTNSWDDNVSVIDAASLSPIRTLRTGWEPTSVVTDKSGTTLYVANRLSDSVSVIDLLNQRQIKSLSCGHGASYLTRSPSEPRVYCTHVYPNLHGFRQVPESEITVIDTERQIVVEQKMLSNAAGIFHSAISSDGMLGVVAQIRPKNLIPMAHVEHGWVFGDSIALFGSDVHGTIQVPLDELDHYFAMPFAVVITPDKSKIYVSTSGDDSVTAIAVVRLLRFVALRHEPFANDLSASANYVLRRIPVGRNPRGMSLSPDGKTLYVVNRMDDSISVVDTKADRTVKVIDLGGAKTINARRRGEQIFYSARYAFQGQFSCANCHIDATLDGLSWDLEPDGFGKNIVDNRSIESLRDTEPFKWNGGNPDLPTECGPRTEKYFYRSQGYDAHELSALTTYVQSIPSRPNRYRLAGGELTPAQARGRTIFERSRYKSGRPIPRHNQCAYCHRGAKFTNQKLAYVGTTKSTDSSEMIDVPHLINSSYSAPYLHDGSARTLDELWTKFNTNDAHGVTSDLSQQEIQDLVEYLKTL
jgi:YVTN family beta-propeller protein